MGKKHQRDREERREKYASRQQKQNYKNKIIIAAVAAVILSIIGYSVFEFVKISNDAPGAPEGAGKLGSAHVHAGMLVNLFGDSVDFSAVTYQVKSPWIHFEGQNGHTVHMHATGVPLTFMFDSLGINLSDECFILPDQREFCTDDAYTLKFFVNGESVSEIGTHVIAENDRVLVSYGAETDEEIDGYLQDLENLLLDIR